MKIPFVAATALFAYNNKPELGTELLNKAASALQKYIDSGSWREVKLLVRFLGCLQPLFEGDGIFTLLEELFARAVDLQTASSEDVRFLISGKQMIITILTFFSRV
jgi:nuclear cap-binding protein subunit 1